MRTPRSSLSVSYASALLCLLSILTDAQAVRHQPSVNAPLRGSSHATNDNIAPTVVHSIQSLYNSVGGETCLNRPVTESGNDYFRYPVCPRQTAWNAGLKSSSQRAVDDGDDSAGDGSIDSRSSGPLPTAALKTHASASTATYEPPQTARIEEQDDHESPLDNANFLSFEEWREQNLARIGQSADSVAARRKEPRARPQAAIRNNLESLGEEGEIDLDFGGFVPDINAATAATPGRSSPQASDGEVSTDADFSASAGWTGHAGDDVDEHAHPGLTRRRNAGVTCKERSNYASFDCAATVLKTNRECTGVSSVLIENKDSYMLNECRARDKFIILELCDDILIDTIVLANFEFFSSRFRTFRVSVSDRYPPKPDKWRDLGIFEALNTREIQAFPVENPLIWARYVKIEFLTHYGNEFCCPLSLIRVHGTTMMEEFKSEGEHHRVDETIDEGDAALSEMEPEGITVVDTVVPINETQNHDGTPFKQPAAFQDIEIVSPETVEDLHFPLFEDFGDMCWTRGLEIERLLLRTEYGDITHVCGLEDFSTPTSEESSEGRLSTTNDVVNTASAPSGGHDRATMLARTPTPDPATRERPLQTVQGADKSTATDTSDSVPSPDAIKTVRSSSQASSQSASSASSVAPATPSPTTQESFFKSMNKRLQMLETNSTLSLLYIGEQSKVLREAFSKVEKRQLGKTTAFLENLNHTVLTELHDFRQQYDQVWQSVIMEFEQQRMQYNREVFAMTRQLGVLADEILFQKRLSLVQSIFVLILFGIVLLSRDTVRRYLELPPRVQGMLSRGGGSPGLRTPWQRSPLSLPLRSPSHSPSTVPGSPVSDAVARQPEVGKTNAVRHTNLRHRQFSPSTGSQNDDSVGVPSNEDAFSVAGRSAAHKVRSSSSSSSSAPSILGEPGPELEGGQVVEQPSSQSSVKLTPSSSTNDQPTEIVVPRGLAESSGNRQKLPPDSEKQVTG